MLYPIRPPSHGIALRPGPIAPSLMREPTMRRLAFAAGLFILSSSSLVAQTNTRPARDSSAQRRAAEHVPKRSRADTLRGSFTTPGRSWWDVAFYDLHVAIRPNDSTVAGYNGITYKVLKP